MAHKAINNDEKNEQILSCKRLQLCSILAHHNNKYYNTYTFFYPFGISNRQTTIALKTIIYALGLSTVFEIVSHRRIIITITARENDL